MLHHHNEENNQINKGCYSYVTVYFYFLILGCSIFPIILISTSILELLSCVFKIVILQKEKTSKPFLSLNYKNLYTSRSMVLYLLQLKPHTFLPIHILPPLYYFPNHFLTYLHSNMGSHAFKKIYKLHFPQHLYFLI